ncbi:hypothetical protein J6590_015176 [Homalodisca vitripennis]|nr:hypothetical protein J6590_015176 [Homalodisca vitripennis]
MGWRYASSQSPGSYEAECFKNLGTIIAISHVWNLAVVSNGRDSQTPRTSGARPTPPPVAGGTEISGALRDWHKSVSNFCQLDHSEGIKTYQR